jgi:hypothetical protein
MSWILGFLYQYTEIIIFTHAHTLLTGSQGVMILWAFGMPSKSYREVNRSRGVE